MRTEKNLPWMVFSVVTIIIVSALANTCVGQKVPPIDRPIRPGPPFDKIFLEENNLQPSEERLMDELCRYDRFFLSMLQEGSCGWYPKGHPLPRTDSTLFANGAWPVPVWHRVKNETSRGEYDGPYSTMDFSLLNPPASLDKKHHALFWSLVRKRADRGYAKMMHWRKVGKKRRADKEFLPETEKGHATHTRSIDADRKRTLAFLKAKPEKLPGVPWLNSRPALPAAAPE